MAIDVKYEIEKSDLDALSIITSLKLLKFSIGLFERANLTDKVIIHSLDESLPDYEYELTLSDILFFVERGTINTKPIHFLEEIQETINRDLHFYLGEWIKSSLQDENPYESMLAKLVAYKDYVNASVIPNITKRLISSLDTINHILKEEEQNVWFYDIKKLIKYITCRLEIVKK